MSVDLLCCFVSYCTHLLLFSLLVNMIFLGSFFSYSCSLFLTYLYPHYSIFIIYLKNPIVIIAETGYYGLVSPRQPSYLACYYYYNKDDCFKIRL